MFCDPTGSDIGAAQKGALWLDFSVKGHSRHIMESRQSVNALSCTLKFTEKLSGQFKKISSHRILGDCSVFLTQIRTNGNATWMIPGFVTGRIDVRVTPCIEIDSAKKIINDTRIKVEESMPGSSLKINIINERAPVGMASDAPLSKIFKNYAGRMEGIQKSSDRLFIQTHLRLFRNWGYHL